jgi:hypothetical protein
MSTAATPRTATDGKTIRGIADEAFAALNSGGRHVVPFSTRYPAFSLNDAYRVAANWENLNRNALAFLRLASIRLMLRKLCNPA